MPRNPDREPVFRFKQFEVRNTLAAMKVGTDGVTLGAWCTILPGDSVLDVGTGCGLIALMARQRGAASVTAVEIDAAAASEAAYNVSSSPWPTDITVINADFLATDFSCRFNRIVSNPPFFEHGIKAPDAARATARHTAALSYPALISRAASLLMPSGSLALIAPSPALPLITESAAMSRLHFTRITHLFTKPGKEPIRVLCELSPCAAGCSHSDLILNSPDYNSIVAPFYLKL